MGQRKILAILALSKHLSTIGDFTLEELNLAAIHCTLKNNNWNRTVTSEILGCVIRTVRYRIMELLSYGVRIKPSTPRPRKIKHISDTLICINTDCTKSTLCAYHKNPLDIANNNNNAHDLIEEKCTWYRQKI